MGIPVTAEAPINSNIGDDGGAPPCISGGVNTVGGTRHGELVPVHQPRTDSLQRRDTSKEMHLSDGHTRHQQKRRLHGHRSGGGLM